MAQPPKPGDTHYNLLWKIAENTVPQSPNPWSPKPGDSMGDLLKKIAHNTSGYFN